MKKIALALALLSGTVLEQAAQDKPAAKSDASELRFEVASVRAGGPNEQTNWDECKNGHRFKAENTPLKLLVAIAFHLSDNRVEGLGGETMDAKGFTLNATSGEKTVNDDECRAMLRNLLRDRFHLKAHRETRTVHGYELTLMDHHDSLKEVSGETGMIYIMSNGISGKGMTMRTLVSVLSRPVGKTVKDGTGLGAKKYDIDLKFAPQDGEASDLPALPNALMEQYGLKLKPMDVPTEYLVVEKMDKVPTEE